MSDEERHADEVIVAYMLGVERQKKRSDSAWKGIHEGAVLAMQARINELEGQLNAITDDAVDRIFQLEAAIDDLLQYVSRADWHYLKPETIQALEDRAHD